jgi:hypothetical protein
MVGVEMAVGYRIDLVDIDPDRPQGILDRDRPWVVPLVELGVAKAESCIEQEQATGVPNEVAHHHALKPGQLVIRE